MMRFRILVAVAALALLPAAATFAQVTEGFDDINTLGAAGWIQVNRSEPLGVTGWFQGNSAVFPSHAGGPNAYIGANFNNGSGVATISNWLLTPMLRLADGQQMTFFTRSVNNFFPDRMQVRLSTAGPSADVGTSSTSVGSFTTLLQDINPTYDPNGYPVAWTQFTVTVTGVPSPTYGRFAFRYFVENGGPSGANSNFIGVDTVVLPSTPYIRGDFNTNNATDLLWRHDTSGENVAWFMNGATLVAGTFLNPAALTDVRWKMVGTNDFNVDGQTDILWRHDTAGENVLWFMNGVNLVSGTFLTPAALEDTNWKMAGTGFFNADGQVDIAWYHEVSGQVVLWYMNGSVMTSGTFTTPSSPPDTNWGLVGVADFSQDGRPDFLWRHRVSGWNAVWFMADNVLTSATFTNPPLLADTNWVVGATGDYNFDGRTDIVWRNNATGDNMMWFMNGVTMTGGAATSPLADVGWKMVGPR
jgi:hypothetical protein